MSSSTEKLPPYQEKSSSTEETIAPSAITSRLAGAVQTCSIKDYQFDYFTIVRHSDSTYQLSLTVDPTPLYLIKVVPDPTKVGNIQIFSASDCTLPLAAAYISTNPTSKKLPVGSVCTSSPTDTGASWRPISRATGFLALHDYWSWIPVVKVPGRAAEPQSFSWFAPSYDPILRLVWDGRLPNVPSWMDRQESTPSTRLFATAESKPDGEIIVEIRRGGGIDFELSVILHVFLILQLKEKAKST